MIGSAAGKVAMSPFGRASSSSMTFNSLSRMRNGTTGVRLKSRHPINTQIGVQNAPRQGPRGVSFATAAGWLAEDGETEYPGHEDRKPSLSGQPMLSMEVVVGTGSARRSSAGAGSAGPGSNPSSASLDVRPDSRRDTYFSTVRATAATGSAISMPNAPPNAAPIARRTSVVEGVKSVESPSIFGVISQPSSS